MQSFPLALLQHEIDCIAVALPNRYADLLFCLAASTAFQI